MIILASTSPRRKEILEEILQNDDFKIVPSSFDEGRIQSKDLRRLCNLRAIAKGEEVSKTYNGTDDFVISADTMVSFKNEIMGKPKSRADAKRMLEILSNNSHKVYTAYAIFNAGRLMKHKVCQSLVFIEKLSDYEIEQYLDSGSPFDKAGAYGIQDTEFINAKCIKGDYYTIMGLPFDSLNEDLIELGLIK